MKVCPKCNETYGDDSLNFCLNDGTALQASSGSEQATAIFSGARVQPAATAQVNYNPTQMVGAGSTMASVPAKKRSKAWIWVLLILGAVVLVCGGGIGGLIYLGSQVPTTANFSTPSSNKAAPSSPADSPKSGKYDLTKAKYEQIKDGTTRAEAERILGGPGEELSSTTAVGTTYSTVKWEGEGYSSVILSFKDDKVFSRVQVGLK